MNATLVATLAVAVAVTLAVMLAVVWRKSASYRLSYEAALDSLSRRPATASSAEREALRLGKILASIPDGIMVVERGEIVYANPATARLLGGDPARIVPAVAQAPRDSVLVTVHHPEYREVRCTRAVLEEGSLLVSLRDVTEARRLDRMRQDFVANASHELKTPVSAILATTETLESAIEDDIEAARRFVRTLGSEASRLSAMVQDLLDLARLDQANDDALAQVDAHAVVDELIAEYRERVPAMTFETSGSAGATVPVRPQDLTLAIRNLVDNAVRATSEGGAIEIAITAGPPIEIAVKDSGIGIPARDLPRIFERFYRVDPARSRDTGGTGLGLAIVKHVVETAGGTVTAESVYGEGSTFKITLPRASDR